MCGGIFQSSSRNGASLASFALLRSSQLGAAISPPLFQPGSWSCSCFHHCSGLYLKENGASSLPNFCPRDLLRIGVLQPRKSKARSVSMAQISGCETCKLRLRPPHECVTVPSSPLVCLLQHWPRVRVVPHNSSARTWTGKRSNIQHTMSLVCSDDTSLRCLYVSAGFFLFDRPLT